MNTDHVVQQRLAEKIEAPRKQSCRPGVVGFGEQLAATVLAINPKNGFVEALAKIMDTRLELALAGDDFETLKSLIIFNDTRAKGITPPGMKGYSITKIHKKSTYARLYELMYEAYFLKSEDIYRCDIFLPHGGKWCRTLEYICEESKINIHHAANIEVPEILNYLDTLWESVITCKSPRQAAADLARFEWWFIAPNISGNAGASIGNCLSLVLQLALGIPFKGGFEHIDWEILSRPLETYLTWRCKKIEKAV